MEIQDGQRYEALLNRGMADEWVPGVAVGARIRLDSGETVTGEDVAVLRPEGDSEAWFRWWHTDARTGKRSKTRHLIKPAADMMGEDDTRNGPFVPDLGSREVRSNIGSAGDIGGR